MNDFTQERAVRPSVRPSVPCCPSLLQSSRGENTGAEQMTTEGLSKKGHSKRKIDLYAVLGIDKGATPSQITKAYRSLALRCVRALHRCAACPPPAMLSFMQPPTMHGTHSHNRPTFHTPHTPSTHTTTAHHQVPSRPECGHQLGGGGGEVQGDLDGLRDPVGPEQAAAVRLVRRGRRLHVRERDGGGGPGESQLHDACLWRHDDQDRRAHPHAGECPALASRASRPAVLKK